MCRFNFSSGSGALPGLWHQRREAFLVRGRCVTGLAIIGCVLYLKLCGAVASLLNKHLS